VEKKKYIEMFGSFMEPFKWFAIPVWSAIRDYLDYKGTKGRHQGGADSP